VTATTSLDSFRAPVAGNHDLDLLRDAKTLLETNRGVLYRGSCAVLAHAIKLAEEKADFSDLREWFPVLKEKHASLKIQLEKEQREQAVQHQATIELLHGDKTLPQLCVELARLEAESMKMFAAHQRLRPDERTQRRAHVLNHADAIARAKVLVMDAIAQRKKSETP
jgi:hypothetical protein